MRLAAALLIFVTLCTPCRAAWLTERLVCRTFGAVLPMKLTIAGVGGAFIATTEVDRDLLMPVEAWALKGKLAPVVRVVSSDDARHLYRFARLAEQSKDEHTRDKARVSVCAAPVTRIAIIRGTHSIELSNRPQAALIRNLMEPYYDADLVAKLEDQMVRAVESPPGGKFPDSLRRAFESFRETSDLEQKRRIIDRVLNE